MVAEELERKGWEQLDAGVLEEAEEYFRQALELDPLRIDALTGLGVIFSSWREYEQAEEIFRLAVAQAERELPRNRRNPSPSDVRVRLYLRSLYYLAKNYVRQYLWTEARHVLKEVLAWDPSGLDGKAHVLMGYAYHRIYDKRQAIHYYEKVVDTRPDVHFSLGLIYYQKGQATLAEKAWAAAAAQCPELAQAIVMHPQVVPIRIRGWAQDHRFKQVSRYIEETIDLWSSEDKRALRQLVERVAG